MGVGNLRPFISYCPFNVCLPFAFCGELTRRVCDSAYKSVAQKRILFVHVMVDLSPPFSRQSHFVQSGIQLIYVCICISLSTWSCVCFVWRGPDAL